MTYRQKLKHHIKFAKDLDLSLRPSRSLSCSILCRLFGKARHPKLELSHYDYSFDSGLQSRKPRSLHSVFIASTTLMVGLPILLWSFDSTSAFYEPQNLRLTDDQQQVAIKSLSLPPLPSNTPVTQPALAELLQPSTSISLTHSETDSDELFAEDISVLDEDTFFDKKADQIAEPLEPDNPWQTLVVQAGDSLSVLFERNDLSSNDMHNMLRAANAHKSSLLRLLPGQKIHVKRSLEVARHVEELVLRLDFEHQLRIYADAEGYISEAIKLPVKTQTVAAHGTIKGSLYASANRAGLPKKFIPEMMKIFRYDIDFTRLQPGDEFSVVYERQVIEGKTRASKILAVKFTNSGQTFRAVRYQDDTGYTDYYTPKGNSLRKAFLRAPLEYTRISSRFNLTRRHPILHKIRAHRGVDFAAPKGTPVYAAGDGVIEFVGRKRGYGKTIVVKHNFGNYSTLYAHLSGFQEKLKKGQRVRQGHTIGFVGSTGLSTGNHLHYEFRIKGVHKDPLTVKLPKSTPLPKEYKADFLKQTQHIVAQLEATDAAPEQVAAVTRTAALNDHVN